MIEKWDPEIRLLGNDAEKLGLSSVGHAREINPKVDLTLIKEWYEDCFDNHTGNCPSRRVGHEEDDPLQDLLLINVEEMCVESVIPAKGSSYVALSYVWGDPAKMVSLTLGNREALKARGALLDLELPKTITDAVRVVQGLCEKYIWIDALCIVQDDPVQQALQISQMDKIYSSASLVIVAASGEDATSGLLGVKEEREILGVYEAESVPFSLVESSLQDTPTTVRLVMSPPHLVYVLSPTKWNTRAWTFQEWQFARRVLIFTPIQVYFACGHSSRSEDTMLEEMVPNMQVSVIISRTEASIVAHYLPYRYIAYNIHSAWSDYTSIVKDYSSRSLTHPEDVLPAVSGLLNNLHRASQNRFIYGMSIGLLHDALLWIPSSFDFERRSNPNTAGPLLPSWSWAAWTGGVKHQGLQSSKCLVEIWTLCDDTGRRSVLGSPLLETPQNDHGMPDALGLPQLTLFSRIGHEDMTEAAQKRRVGEGLILDPNHIDWTSELRLLCFSAQVIEADVYMVRRLMETQADGVMVPGPSLIGVAILDKRRTWTERNVARKVACIAVSETEWPLHEMTLIGYVNPEMSLEFLNVLIVEEMEEKSLRTYERIGVGQVHKDGWGISNAEIRDIQLA